MAMNGNVGNGAQLLVQRDHPLAGVTDAPVQLPYAETLQEN